MYKKILCVLAAALCLCSCTEETSSETSGEKSGGSEKGSSLVVSGGKKEYTVFDNTNIVKAFKTGDKSGLSDLEEKILDEAESVFTRLRNENQYDIEFEIAVHDYIVESATYDPDALKALGKPSENSDNPYGVLVEKKGICLGYSTTFQLFMDMAEIPCITIYSNDESGDEHGWNEVQIEGNWYYVDCTWDDPVPDYNGRKAYHKYFNLTEQQMKDSGHSWDAEKCYPADSDNLVYYKVKSVLIDSVSEGESLIKKAVESGEAEIHFSSTTDLSDSISELHFDDFMVFVTNTDYDGGFFYCTVEFYSYSDFE